MTDFIERSIVGIPGKIRFEGEVYLFHPHENCPPVFPKPFKVWCKGIPPIGQYFIDRLQVYNKPDSSSGKHWIGYADRIKRGRP